MQQKRTIKQQPEGFKYKRCLIIFIILSLFLQACGFYIYGPHYGTVIDAETKEPLDNVAVTVQIDCDCPRYPAGGYGKTLAVEETLTDKNGKFKLPLKFCSMPFFCFAYNSLAFLKPGYFETRESHSPNVKSDEYVKLFKMRHYLNYLKYKKYYPSSDYQEESKYYRDAIDIIKSTKVIPDGAGGVFFSMEKRKFTKIFSNVNKRLSISYTPGSISKRIFYLYDEVRGEWIAIDGRGMIVDCHFKTIPAWSFFSAHLSWGDPIFANNEHIFYPVDKNSIPMGFEYTKGEIKYITPIKGDISALVGYVDDFLTVEDNGSLLCHYIFREFSKWYKVAALPGSEKDELEINSKFKFIAKTLNHGYYTVTKDSKHWCVYHFARGYNEETKKAEWLFEKLISFPIEKEITAFTARGGTLYVAFKNEGVRKYEVFLNRGMFLKENPAFLKNSKTIHYPDICSLDIGWAVNGSAVYAVSGGSNVYRFSTDGIPDFKVKLGAYGGLTGQAQGR